MRIPKTLSVFLCLAALGLSAAAEPVDYKSEPGYVEVDVSEAFGEDIAPISFHFPGPMLAVIAGIVSGDDDVLSRVLKNLHLVSVKIYPHSEDGGTKIKEIVGKKLKSLLDDGWVNSVHVDKEEGDFELLFKMDDETIQGLVAFGLPGDGEFIFINIVGTIDGEQLGKLLGKLDVDGIPGLDELEIPHGESSEDDDSDEDEEQ